MKPSKPHIRRGVTKGMLRDQIGMSGPRPFLLCIVCGNECSANAGDYFNLAETYLFRCCEEPMQLATKRTQYSIL